MPRNWGGYPSRINTEIHSAAGAAALSGLLTTAASAASYGVIGATASAVLFSSGLTLAVAALGFACYRAFPKNLMTAQNGLGNEISLEELSRYEPIEKLAIIGPSKAGKTTLLTRLAIKPSRSERTQQVTATIVVLNVSPPKYYALLDGGGEINAHQLHLVEIADKVIMVFDHNDSDVEIDPNAERLAKCEEFLVQVHAQIRFKEKASLEKIIVLHNKKDLWQSSSQVNLMREHIEKIKRRLDDYGQCRVLVSLEHSNNDHDDMVQLVEALR